MVAVSYLLKENNTLAGIARGDASATGEVPGVTHVMIASLSGYRQSQCSLQSYHGLCEREGVSKDERARGHLMCIGRDKPNLFSIHSN